MKKFVKSKFDNQLESHKIFKKKLNLVKHKNNLYDLKNHTETVILQEQDAVSLNSKLILNDNVIKLKKRRKDEPSIEASTSLKPKQNENSTSKVQLPNTIDTNYSKEFNCFSQSVEYSSLSHCNSKLLDSSFCTDFSCDIAGKSVTSRQKQLKEVVFGYSQGKKNISTTVNNIEITNMAHAAKTNRDLVPSYRILRSSLPQTKQEYKQNRLQTDNTQSSTPTNSVLKAKRTESKVLKRNMSMTLRNEKIKRKDSNRIRSYDALQTKQDLELAGCEKNFGEKTDIIVPTFAHDSTSQGSVRNETKKNEDPCSQSEGECSMIPLKKCMKTRAMVRMECIKIQKDLDRQKVRKNVYEKKHVIEVEEETIFQQNLQMTTHFHSKSHTLSCNLHGNNSSRGRAIQGSRSHLSLNRKQQRDLRYSRGESNRGLISKLQEDTDITETILQSNLQCLVDSKLNDNCNISMEVNKKNEYEVNKSVKINNSKANVHNSIKKKEIIESECHIEIKKRGQDAFDSLKKCEHNAIETTKKTFLSKMINKRKSINSFKAITQGSKNNVMVNKHFQITKELIVPLIKLENLPLAKLTQLMHIPHYIENKINISKGKETRYTVRNTSTDEKCTIIRKQYKVTKMKKNGEFNNDVKKRKDQRKYNLCKNKEERRRPSQEISENSEDDNNLATEKLENPMAKKSTDMSSSSSTREYFTTNAECQQINENECMPNQCQELVSNKDCRTRFNETILEQTNAETERSNFETDAHNEIRASDNEVGKAETLQNSKSELHANELLQNIYKFYLKNKIKRINSKITSKYITCKKQKLKIPRQIAICSRCKQIFNLLQQFSGKTNFTNDEKIQIECTLCNVHMHSLSRFQQHLMDAHLQCEGQRPMITKSPYTVDIINFNGEKKSTIYECCCCLKVFNRLGNFKRHLKDVHRTFYNVSFQQKIRKNGQMINNSLKTEALCYTAKILNRLEDSTNVLSNSNLDVNTEGNRMETSEMKSLESSNLNSADNQSDQKQSKTICKRSLYRCKICAKSYKTEGTLLLHMLKHPTNSNNSKTSEKTLQQTLNNGTNKVKTNIHLSHDRSNDELPFVALNGELGDAKCDSTTEERIPENSNSSGDVNTNEQRALEGKDTFDFHCMLHVNCTGTLRTGEKRQQFIKCNVNISKKLKTDDTVQQTGNNGIKGNLLTNHVNKPDVIYNGVIGTGMSDEQVEIECKMCNIKFNSRKILKEHMFFLHDSVFEDREVLKLLDPDNSNNNATEENVSSAEGDENSRSENNIPTGETPEIFMADEGRIYENIICEMLSDCSINKRNKKWRCNLCKENFALIRNYLRHKYYIHNDVSVVHVCDNCNKVLTSVAMVNIHKCTNVTCWSCRRCNLEFINGTYLTQHNINCHFETAGPHTCDVCETSFLTQYMLEKHRLLHSSTNDSNNVNSFLDMSMRSQNDLRFNLNSEGNSAGSDSESDSDSNAGDDFEYVTKNDKSVTTSMNEATKNLNGPAEPANIFLNKFSISLDADTEEMFKCKICDIVCLTKKQMKYHLENWHETNAEVCELCNRLYVANELIEHLINCHIVTNDFDSTGSNTGAQLNRNRAGDFQRNVIDLLGLKRLVTLYEYQRFNDPKNNCFNCVVCLMQFLSTQSYKMHYLKFHDTVCLLCNIEFAHQYQAFEHKIKIHVSADSYLWVVEKITASILQFNEIGSTLEDMILQCSVHDGERYTPELFSLSNNKFEELNNKEFVHAAENVTSFT